MEPWSTTMPAHTPTQVGFSLLRNSIKQVKNFILDEDFNILQNTAPAPSPTHIHQKVLQIHFFHRGLNRRRTWWIMPHREDLSASRPILSDLKWYSKWLPRHLHITITNSSEETDVCVELLPVVFDADAADY